MYEYVCNSLDKLHKTESLSIAQLCLYAKSASQYVFLSFVTIFVSPVIIISLAYLMNVQVRMGVELSISFTLTSLCFS